LVFLSESKYAPAAAAIVAAVIAPPISHPSALFPFFAAFFFVAMMLDYY
jgi:hypothetical protein